MMMEEGIVTLRRVSVDSTIMKANASAWKSKDLSEWKKLSEAIEEEVRRYLQECEETDRNENRDLEDHDGFSLPKKLRKKSERKKVIDKAIGRVERRLEKEDGLNMNNDPRFSPTDPDARTISRHNRVSLGYNSQIVVDHDSGMVVAARVPETITDQKELIPNIEEVSRNTGNLHEEVLADSGYASGEAFEKAEGMGVNAYVSEKPSGRRTKYFAKEKFRYEPEKDTFTCPAGKTLSRTRGGGISPHLIYRADRGDCEACPLRKRCFNTRNSKYKVITTDRHEPARQRMRIKMTADESRQKYRERGYTVEPVIGKIKEGIGIRGFRLRGKSNVDREWSPINLAYNLKRWHRILMARREAGKSMALAFV